MRKLILVLLAMPMAANAIPIEVTGTTSSDGNWDVTLVEGTWTGLLTDLMAQEWWSDRTLAIAFADALGGLAGYPNVSNIALGPLFATNPAQEGDGFTLFGACREGFSCESYQFASGGGQGLIRTWAVATRVPEPGTLALFGLGLAAMGLARRRKNT